MQPKNQHIRLLFRAKECVVSVLDGRGREIAERTVDLDFNQASEDDFVRMLAQEIDLRNEAHSVEIVVESPHCALIPKDLYHAEDAALFLDFQGESEQAKILANQSDELGFVTVFTVPEPFFSALSRFAAPPEIRSHLVSVIESNQRSLNGQTMLLWLRKPFFDLLVFADTALQFYNSFHFRTEEDVLYYVAKISELHAFDFQKLNLLVYHTEKQKDVIELLQRYVHKIVIH